MAPERKKILLVDAEVDLCTLLRNYYRRKNHDVYIAHGADDAVEAIKQNPPDFILLSLELQGWEKVRKQAAISAPNARFL